MESRPGIWTGRESRRHVAGAQGALEQSENGGSSRKTRSPTNSWAGITHGDLSKKWQSNLVFVDIEWTCRMSSTYNQAMQKESQA